MLEGLTVIPKSAEKENKRSYFDEQVFSELKAFICGDVQSSDAEGGMPSLPSFQDVIDKINSFVLREDLRVRIICETLSKLLQDLNKHSEMPQFLVSYLCHEALVHSVLRKFNSVLGGECVDLIGLSHKIGDNVAEADKVFLSLKICDPAACSGQFLCTMLNEMISVKSQLGLLVDTDGNPLYQYKFVSEYDGLKVFDKKEFKAISLNGETSESRYIQQTLFHEKENLLNQCLFGVDSNALSVLLCRLRLWVDIVSLLEGSKDAVLPCVEANIICGDALVSRFTLKDDLLVALKNINQTVVDYKRLSESIKKAENSSDRQYLIELMTLVKNRLIEGIGWYSKDSEELLSLRRQLSEIMTPGLFPLSEKESEVRNEKILSLHAQIRKQDQQISTFRHNPAFETAVEWRYDFPELLDEKGAFSGFDAMIGTLPDAVVAGIGGDRASLYKRMNFRIYKRSGNVADLFCELANRLLSYGGCMAYIMSSGWRREPENSKVGDYLVAEMNPLQLVEFDKLDDAYKELIGKCAVTIEKDINHHRTIACDIDASYNPQVADLGTYMQQFAVPIFRLVEKGGGSVETSVASIITSNAEYMSISGKIKKRGLLVKNWDVNIYSGVMTGCDEAFVVDKEKRDELINKDYKNTDIIKPLLTGDFIKRYGDEIPEKWLIYIPWHFPLQYDTTIKAASERAEQRFQQQYPDIYKHLLSYKDSLSSRNTIEVGLGFEWYALQRSGMNNNWNDFTELKVVWKRDSLDYNFGLDYGGCAVLDDTCFMVGQHIKFLLGVFNSTMGKYMLNDLSRLLSNESSVGISVIESMSVPVPNGKMEADIITLVNRRIAENHKSEEEKLETEERLNRLVFELYDLNEEEIAFIKNLHV